MIGLNRLLLLLVLGHFSISVQSLKFELQSGKVKCLSEYINSNSLTMGNYSIVNPHPDQPFGYYDPSTDFVTLRPHCPVNRFDDDGSRSYHHGEGVKSGQFSFVAVKGGDYLACLSTKLLLTVDFDWKTGVAAKDWSLIAKRTHVDSLTQQMEYMTEIVSSIQEEMIHQRQELEEMEVHDWATMRRMFWLSFLSLFICISVAGLQLWNLKTFFQKKKVL